MALLRSKPTALGVMLTYWNIGERRINDFTKQCEVRMNPYVDEAARRANGALPFGPEAEWLYLDYDARDAVPAVEADPENGVAAQAAVAAYPGIGDGSRAALYAAIKWHWPDSEDC